MVPKERTRPLVPRVRHLNDKKETGPLAGSVSGSFFAETGSKRFV